MLCKKIIGSFFTATCLYGASTLAYANDVTLDNQSNYDLYFTMNNDSSKATGFLPSGSKKIMAEEDFKKSCEDQYNHCEIEIHQSSTGKEVSIVIFEATNLTSFSNTMESDVRVGGHHSNVIISNK